MENLSRVIQKQTNKQTKKQEMIKFDNSIQD